MSTDAPEIRALPANVTIAKEIIKQDHLYVIGQVNCPAAGVEVAYLMVDMKSGEVVMAAECGCRAGIRLSTLLLQLGAMLAKGHDSKEAGAPAGCQVH